MSNIYIQEPPTNGKILLSTSVGDIDIELWSKEAPKACRNFVQLCMEGYYDGTIFHRVVPEFIVQGGDPTGTGTGGESIYGKPFRDEFHTRLRFVRRGLVAMANAGPHDNASQFFFTLGQTQELNNKHTIFGKVAGDTVYNMLKLAEVEIGPEDRPLYPHNINKTKIISNPFEDIVPRRVARRKSDEDEASKKKKSKSKATKNFSLLSFGEEAEEEEVQIKKANKSMKSKSKSSHDLLDDSKLSATPALETKDLNKLKRKHQREEEEGNEEEKPLKEDLTDSSEEEDNKEAAKERIRKKLKSGKKDDVHKSSKYKEEREDEDDNAGTKSKTLEELKKEARRLKRELRATKAKETKEEEEEREEEETAKVDPNTPIDALQGFKADRLRYKEKQKAQPKKGSSREAQTMALLAKFQSRLNSAKELAEENEEEVEEKEEEIEEKVQITEDGEEVHEEEDDGSDIKWLSHKLKFDANARKVLDANIHDADRYEIYDPRNPLTKRRREASEQAMKEKH